MSDVFAAAVDDLFTDPHLARTALYRAGGIGAGVSVQVVARRPDRIIDLGASAVQVATTVFEVRVSEVASPAEGDTFTLDDATFVVQGEPTREATRLIWTVETR